MRMQIILILALFSMLLFISSKSEQVVAQINNRGTGTFTDADVVILNPDIVCAWNQPETCYPVFTIHNPTDETLKFEEGTAFSTDTKKYEMKEGFESVTAVYIQEEINTLKEVPIQVLACYPYNITYLNKTIIEETIVNCSWVQQTKIIYVTEWQALDKINIEILPHQTKKYRLIFSIKPMDKIYYVLNFTSFVKDPWVNATQYTEDFTTTTQINLTHSYNFNVTVHDLGYATLDSNIIFRDSFEDQDFSNWNVSAGGSSYSSNSTFVKYGSLAFWGKTTTTSASLFLYARLPGNFSNVGAIIWWNNTGVALTGTSPSRAQQDVGFVQTTGVTLSNHVDAGFYVTESTDTPNCVGSPLAWCVKHGATWKNTGNKVAKGYSKLTINFSYFKNSNVTYIVNDTLVTIGNVTPIRVNAIQLAAPAAAAFGQNLDHIYDEVLVYGGNKGRSDLIQHNLSGFILTSVLNKTGTVIDKINLSCGWNNVGGTGNDGVVGIGGTNLSVYAGDGDYKNWQWINCSVAGILTDLNPNLNGLTLNWSMNTTNISASPQLNYYNLTIVVAITDTVAPTWNSITNNASTITQFNGDVKWTANVSDETELSFFIMATNMTGFWSNESAYSFPGGSRNATIINYIMKNNASANKYICGKIWFNDTSNNVNQTDNSCFTVSSNIDACSVIDKEGIYTLIADIRNSPAPVCMNLSADNIILDCQGHMINGNGSNQSRGIYAFRNLKIGINNITIRNCNVSNFTNDIYEENINVSTIEYNNVSGNIVGSSPFYSYQIYLRNVNNVSIYNNYVSDARGALVVAYSSNIYVINNTFSNNHAYGAFFENSSRVILDNINASNNVNWGVVFAGSLVTRCYDILLTNITTNNNGKEGMSIQRTTNYEFYNSTSNNNGAGIYLFSIKNGSIHDVSFSSNKQYGMVWDATPNNLSQNNTVYNSLFNNTNNTYYCEGSGQHWSGCDANSIISITNTYWNTSNQTGIRIYSLGTNIGGNYWTNSSSDGYSDTCADANTDGFCDNPLNITNMMACTVGVNCGDNVDYLPLSNKYSVAPPAVVVWCPDIMIGYEWNDNVEIITECGGMSIGGGGGRGAPILP